MGRIFYCAVLYGIGAICSNGLLSSLRLIREHSSTALGRRKKYLRHRQKQTKKQGVQIRERNQKINLNNCKSSEDTKVNVQSDKEGEGCFVCTVTKR